MLTTDQINDLHHLYWVEHWPIRKIEQHLGMSWRTIMKYLEAPAQTPAARSRTSKLDPFKPTIAELPSPSRGSFERRFHTGEVCSRRLAAPYGPDTRPGGGTADAAAPAWRVRRAAWTMWTT